MMRPRLAPAVMEGVEAAAVMGVAEPEVHRLRSCGWGGKMMAWLGRRCVYWAHRMESRSRPSRAQRFSVFLPRAQAPEVVSGHNVLELALSGPLGLVGSLVVVMSMGRMARAEAPRVTRWSV